MVNYRTFKCHFWFFSNFRFNNNLVRVPISQKCDLYCEMRAYLEHSAHISSVLNSNFEQTFASWVFFIDTWPLSYNLHIHVGNLVAHLSPSKHWQANSTSLFLFYLFIFHFSSIFHHSFSWMLAINKALREDNSFSSSLLCIWLAIYTEVLRCRTRALCCKSFWWK